MLANPQQEVCVKPQMPSHQGMISHGYPKFLNEKTSLKHVKTIEKDDGEDQ